MIQLTHLAAAEAGSGTSPDVCDVTTRPRKRRSPTGGCRSSQRDVTTRASIGETDSRPTEGACVTLLSRITAYVYRLGRV